METCASRQGLIMPTVSATDGRLPCTVRLGRRTPFLGWVGRLWDEKSSQDRAAISGTLNLKIAEMGPCPEIGQIILRCDGISG